ncbi:hypothetical protein GYMLUDRAFT_35398, partial [Collybiopsis luxurians FD-317 M1]
MGSRSLTSLRFSSTLGSEQELIVVSSLLANLAFNGIPPIADPKRPIDPQLVLEFDTQG